MWPHYVARFRPGLEMSANSLPFWQGSEETVSTVGRKIAPAGPTYCTLYMLEIPIIDCAVHLCGSVFVSCLVLFAMLSPFELHQKAHVEAARATAELKPEKDQRAPDAARLTILQSLPLPLVTPPWPPCRRSVIPSPPTECVISPQHSRTPVLMAASSTGFERRFRPIAPQVCIGLIITLSSTWIIFKNAMQLRRINKQPLLF